MDRELAEAIGRNASELMNSGYYCSEAILLAVGQHYLDSIDPMALRIATPFMGGVGGSHEGTCGAFSGGLILIGLMRGREDIVADDSVCQSLAAQWQQEFFLNFVDFRCEDLKRNWVSAMGHGNCSELVDWAARILVDILENKRSI